MAFTKLAHAQQNWENVFNSNLDKTQEVQDSGWQKVALLGEAAGDLKIRLFNQILYFGGGVEPNAEGLVKIAILPIRSQRFTAVDTVTNETVACTIDTDSSLTVNYRTTENMGHYLNFGYNLFLVGNINLGGGGKKPFLNHLLWALKPFSTRLEVA